MVIEYFFDNILHFKSKEDKIMLCFGEHIGRVVKALICTVEGIPFSNNTLCDSTLKLAHICFILLTKSVHQTWKSLS